MKIMSPLRYCEFRTADAEGEVDLCATFAGAVYLGLPFCDRHLQMLINAIDDQGVELVEGVEALVMDLDQVRGKKKKEA